MRVSLCAGLCVCVSLCARVSVCMCLCVRVLRVRVDMQIHASTHIRCVCQVLDQLFEMTNFKNAPYFVARLWSLRTGFYLTDPESRQQADQWAQPSIEFEEHGIQSIQDAAKAHTHVSACE